MREEAELAEAVDPDLSIFNPLIRRTALPEAWRFGSFLRVLSLSLGVPGRH